MAPAELPLLGGLLVAYIATFLGAVNSSTAYLSDDFRHLPRFDWLTISFRETRSALSQDHGVFVCASKRHWPNVIP